MTELEQAKRRKDEANKAYVYAAPEDANKAWQDLQEANWNLLNAIMASFPKDDGQAQLPLF